MRAGLKIAGILVLLCLLAACVAGSAESHHAAASGWISQLFLGFWQGILAPFMLVAEVVNVVRPNTLPWSVHMYETAGTGIAYDVGFYFGVLGGPGAILGGWSRRG
jgi:hypothetical protein